jgi:hypothetical protein
MTEEADMRPPHVGRMMVAVAVVTVAALVLTTILTEAAWSGHASIPLEFLILDAATGRAIDGASIRLVEGDPEYQATTGPDGRAKVLLWATVGGRSSFLRDTRAVNYAWTFLVDCNGYRSVTENLREVTRDARYHSDPAPPSIVIRLEQSP